MEGQHGALAFTYATPCRAPRPTAHGRYTDHGLSHRHAEQVPRPTALGILPPPTIIQGIVSLTESELTKDDAAGDEGEFHFELAT